MDIKVTGTKYYYVKISGIVNGMALKDFYSNVASLTIKSLPKITISKEPWDQVAVVGQTTNLPTFSVEVNKIKDVRFEYQWYQNGKYIYGATNSSYKVPASDLKSAGRKRYYVEINGFVNGLSLTNSNSRSALLTINS